MNAKGNRIIAGIVGAFLCLIIFLVWKIYYTGGGETLSVWYFLTINFPVYAILDVLNQTNCEPLVLGVLCIYWLFVGFILAWLLYFLAERFFHLVVPVRPPSSLESIRKAESNKTKQDE